MVVKKLKPTGLKRKIKTKDITLSLNKNIIIDAVKTQHHILTLVTNILAEFRQLKIFTDDAVKNEIANLKNEIANQKEKLEMMEQMNQLRNRFTISQIEVGKLEKTLNLALEQKAIALENFRSLTESVNSAKEGV